MKKLIKCIILVIGLSAVITLTFFLIKSPYKCIIPFEPLWYIRIPEIIIGLFSIIGLILIIKENMK